MLHVQENKLTQRPESEEILVRAELAGRAEAVLPLLKKNAPETDRTRRIPEENIKAIEDAGLFRILSPARFGGYQCTFRTRFDVIAKIAEGCGSTAWVYYILTDLGWVVGLLPSAVQSEVFGDNPNAKVMGQVTPSGTVKKVEGGFILNSKSYYATGSQFAEWALLPVQEVNAAGETVQPLLTLVPAKDYRIEDTWFVSGMRGTASACVTVEDTFVPDCHVFSLMDLVAGKYPTEFKDEATFRTAFMPALSLSTAGPHVGLARAALKHTLDMAEKRAIPFSVYAKQLESTAFQVMIAQAALKIEGAQSLAEKWLSVLDNAGRDQRHLTLLERATVRAVSGQVSRETVAAVDLLLTAHGTGSFAESNPMQRIWRDINIIARHGFVSHGLGDEVLGRALVGGDPTQLTNVV